MQLSNKPLWKGYAIKLALSQKWFFGRYEDLINQYKIPLFRMVHYIPEHDHIQYHPLLILRNTYYCPCWAWTRYRIWPFYQIQRGVQRIFKNEFGLLPENALIFGHLVLSHFGLFIVLNKRPNPQKIVMFPEFEFQISLGTTILPWAFWIFYIPKMCLWYKLLVVSDWNRVSI